MHVTGDLWFSSLVLVLLLVLPVIGFVIRRKWRLSVARKEEIKRLLILASEEAARAELEATVSYGGVFVPSNSYQCAVFYCPNTTRCARCKAVRYCSGKCQIIHWRQGHKEECQPLSDTYHDNDSGHQQYGNAPIGRSFEGPALSNYSSNPEVNHVKGNYHEDEGASTSESLDTSFSGISTSPSGDGSSDDVSVGESISLNEIDGSDGQVSNETVPDVIEPELDKVGQTKPLSPKFASLVDSVNTFEHSSKSNRSEIGSNNGESRHASGISSGQSISAMHEGSLTQPGKVSSGFWDRTLDPVVSSNAAGQNVPGPSSFSVPGNIKSSGSESFLHFKFDLSRSNVPSLNAQSTEVKRIEKDDALPATLGVSRPVDRTTLLGDAGGNAPNCWSSTSVHHEKSNHDSSMSKLSELKSVSFSCGNIPSNNGEILPRVDSHSLKSNHLKSASLSSNISDGAVSDIANTSHISKSRVSSSALQTHMASSANGHLVQNEKSGKVDNIDSDGMNSFHMANSSPSSISGLKSSVRKVVAQLRGPKAGKYNDKGLFSYDVFVKLYISNKVELRPCGLINCGNSCYANAVLQCLAFTPPLTSYFVQGLHSKECVNKKWCFTCEFESLLLKVKEGKSPLSPIGIIAQLQNIGSHLGNGREEDAHEFLRYAIDTMQAVCLKEAVISNASGSYKEETTLMGLTFGGYLCSKIKCMKCHYKSERHERMMDLTVEIEGDIGKLEDALRRFTSTEILDSENKYQCCRCKSYEKAKKKLTILEAPNVLTIALKRFQSGKFGKLNKSIRFPEILDIAPYMSGTTDKSPIYRLFGVVVHLDIMNASFSGHYVCYVKNIRNKWFKIDDSTVTPVELERVLTKGAYMLFYARCSPRAPRWIRSRIVSPDPKLKGSPLRINGRNTALNSRSTSSSSNVHLNPPESVESFYQSFLLLQRILEEDSSSDSYSFTSSNSDEGSCSTESTRDSTSTEDFSDYIFGSWNNTWRNTFDSDTSSSSSSSLYSKHSLQTSRSRRDSFTEGGESGRVPSGSGRVRDLKRGESFLVSDMRKQCRKLATSSSCCREMDSAKLGWVNPVKSSVPFRRSISERTD